MTTPAGEDTRSRLLAAARRRFAGQGYGSTTLAELAADLGTTKAALYYYFRSKAEVLDALLSDPAETLRDLAAYADTGPAPRDLLARFVDAMAGSCQVIIELRGDRSALREHGDRHDLPALEERIVRALAGDATVASRVRAVAALGAARSGVETALALDPDHALRDDLRREILDAAVAVVTPARPTARRARDDSGRT